MAFPTGWLSRSALVVQHTQVPADQTAFPVLITEACFATNCPEILTTGDAHAAQSDGGDLRFSTDSAGASQIACEVVKWVQNATFASAKAEIWVPRNILTASDVTIYVWWEAGGGLSQPAANASFGSQAVWASQYASVYHMGDGTSLSVNDSTANANNGTNHSGTAVTGKVGGGIDFDAQTKYLAVAGAPSGSSLRAFEFWAKTTTSGTIVFYDQGANTSGNRNLIYSASGNNFITVYINGNSEDYSAVNVRDGSWHHICVDAKSSTPLIWQVVIDGVIRSAAGTGAAGLNTTATPQFLNSNVDGNNVGTIGSYDEFRIYNTDMTSGGTNGNWFITGYNNQNSPGTFIIAAARSPVTPGDVSVSDAISLSEGVRTGRGYLFADTLPLSDLVAVSSVAQPAITELFADFINLLDNAVASFAVVIPPNVRGNIDYDQIRVSARSGDGPKLLTFTGSFTAGNVIVFDANGNAVDSGHT